MQTESTICKTISADVSARQLQYHAVLLRSAATETNTSRLCRVKTKILTSENEMAGWILILLTGQGWRIND